MISFLNPALLFGLAAAGIPLILHLIFRREPRRVIFPDLSLLQTVKARESRAVGIRRWLLLLLRMLAIALIVLGAARPRVGGVASGAGDRVSLVAILDASASMQTVDEDGRSRFDGILEEAKAVAAGLPEGSQVQWILAGGSAESIFGGWLPSTTIAGREFGGLRPGDGACDLLGALGLVVEAAEQATHPVSAVFFTDLQDPGLNDEETAAVSRRLTEAGLRSLSVRNLDDGRRGGAVLDVKLPLSAVLAEQAVVVEAEIRAGVEEQVARLELDGEIVAEGVCDAGAGATSRVRFALRAPAAGRHVGRVLTVGDRLAVDDQRPFVLDVHDRVRVLLSHGAGRGSWRYLAHALTPGFDEAVETLDPVDLRVAGTDAWQSGDLERSDVLILVDPDPLGREKTAAVRAWVEAGGSLWLIVGDPARRADLSENLLPGLVAIDSLRFRVRSEAGAERLRLPATGHPALVGLPASSLQTLEEAMWRRNWRVLVPGAEVLGVLEGGDPVLSSVVRGRGRVLLMTSSLDASSCDLAANAMFPPLVQRLVGWLAGGDPRRAEHDADLPLQVALAANGDGEFRGDLVFDFRAAGDDAGEGMRHAADIVWRGRRPWALGPLRPAAGFWTLNVDDDPLTTVVTVVPDSETRAVVMSADDYEKSLETAGLQVVASLTDADPGDVGRLLAGRSLAPWCFLAALLVLLIEHRLARGSSAGGGSPRRLDSADS